MTIYLPIAEMPINILALLILGGVTGILAGMFGIGGGFLMTPLLMLMGVSPAVAVASSANQIVATSFSGFLAHWRRKNVDIKIGIFMTLGGVIGAIIGVLLFAQMKKLGMIDVVIAICYVLFLGSVGILMAKESWQSLQGSEKKSANEVPPNIVWRKMQNLPWKVYFPRSEITISGFLPILIGVLVGLLIALMGIGGGFITIPAMIYLLGIPTAFVVGTALFQSVFITSLVTLLHSIHTQTVDIVLVMLMVLSSVVGAQYGAKLGAKIPPEKLRALLAFMILAVVLKLALGLLIAPNDPFSVDIISVTRNS